MHIIASYCEKQEWEEDADQVEEVQHHFRLRMEGGKEWRENRMLESSNVLLYENQM